jgi:glycosyltransferase involved in cell wall biosynthesis
LKVYVLAPSYPPAPGGQEIHLQELSESLVAAGVEVQVVTAAMEPPGKDFIDTVPVVRLATFGPIQGGGWRSVPVIALLLVRMFWCLVVNARRYDVVLVSGFNITPLAPVFAKLLTRKPCIVRPESPSELKNVVGEASLARMRNPGTGALMRLLARIRRWTATRVDRYIAISSEIRAQLIADGIDPRRIVQIANGINMDKFTPVDAGQRRALRERLGLPPDALVMIYTGRLAISKGVMLLLQSWAELSARYPHAHLVLIGQGAGSVDDCEAQVHRFIRERNLGRQVTAPGSVSNVSEYLQAADMFVFPSFFEGFGLSIVEAMAVGLPMVCTRVGVATELASRLDAELLVQPEDGAAFTRAMERLLSDARLRDVTSRRTRSLVESLFSMSTIARQHNDVFTELAHKQS